MPEMCLQERIRDGTSSYFFLSDTQHFAALVYDDLDDNSGHFDLPVPVRSLR